LRSVFRVTVQRVPRGGVCAVASSAGAGLGLHGEQGWEAAPRGTQNFPDPAEVRLVLDLKEGLLVGSRREGGKCRFVVRCLTRVSIVVKSRLRSSSPLPRRALPTVSCEVSLLAQCRKNKVGLLLLAWQLESGHFRFFPVVLSRLERTQRTVLNTTHLCKPAEALPKRWCLGYGQKAVGVGGLDAVLRAAFDKEARPYTESDPESSHSESDSE
jgi:hypothetical protein